MDAWEIFLPKSKKLYRYHRLGETPFLLAVVGQVSFVIFNKKRGWTLNETSFTIGQIADILECKEHTARMLLNVSGANPKLSEVSHNRDEIVSKQAITNLATLRADGRIGRKLTILLGTWSAEN